MKTIGLIGGMSWESTVTYYQLINKTVNETLGGFHSAKILLFSVDFAEVEACLTTSKWDKAAEILKGAAHKLERAGADMILVCTNTLHKVVPEVQQSIQVPIVHIADAIAYKLQENQIQTVGLLGTKYTMQLEFYRERLETFGIKVMIPDEEDIEMVNRVIFSELCQGIVKEESKAEYLRVMQSMKDKGAQGVILGCTEIGMLIGPEDAPIPSFDTTVIHAGLASKLALEDCK